MIAYKVSIHDGIGGEKVLGIFDGTYEQIAEHLLLKDADLNVQYHIKPVTITDVSDLDNQFVKYCSIVHGVMDYTLDQKALEDLRRIRTIQRIKAKLSPEEFELVKGAL